MTKGVELRSQIDTETVRSLLLINGGGAVALLTLLPSILSKDGYETLAFAILVGLLIFMIGLACAVIHNRLRRKCSLHYELHDMRPPKGRLLGLQLRQPTICFLSLAFMWLSVGAFIVAGSYVAISGIITVRQAQQESAKSRSALPKKDKNELKTPSPTQRN